MIVNIKDGLIKSRINLIRRFFPNYVISKCKEEIRKNNQNLAYKMLLQTYKYHPNNYEINLMLKDLTLMKKNWHQAINRKSTRLNSSHVSISYAVFCLKKNIIIYTGQ